MPKKATLSQKKCKVAGVPGRRSRTSVPTSRVKTPMAASTKYTWGWPVGTGRKDSCNNRDSPSRSNE